THGWAGWYRLRPPGRVEAQFPRWSETPAPPATKPTRGVLGRRRTQSPDERRRNFRILKLDERKPQIRNPKFQIGRSNLKFRISVWGFPPVHFQNFFSPPIVTRSACVSPIRQARMRRRYSMNSSESVVSIVRGRGKFTLMISVIRPGFLAITTI